MPHTYQLFCRPCHVPLEMVPGESKDSRCPTCGVRLPGAVIAELLEIDRRRRKLEATAKEQGLALGDEGIRMPPSDIPDHVRDLVLILEIPDDIGSSG